MGGGGDKIPYPKHVWSPSGGWYSRPANWKGNTLVIYGLIFGITGLVWSASARLEKRDRMPPSDRFFPSRYWSKQIIEHEQKKKAAAQIVTDAAEQSL